MGSTMIMSRDIRKTEDPTYSNAQGRQGMGKEAYQILCIPKTSGTYAMGQMESILKKILSDSESEAIELEFE